MNAGNTAKEELAAMGKVLEALEDLPPEAAGRVVDWAIKTLSLPSITVARSPARTPPASDAGTTVSAATTHDNLGHEDLASFFAALNPSDGPDRALVVCYWKQVVENTESFTGQDINSELKHLGHQLPNITASLSLLMKRKPQQVVQ